MNYEDNYSLDKPSLLKWRLHLKSPPEKVYNAVSTDEGREKFWAEHSETDGKTIRLSFPDGLQLKCKVLNAKPPSLFVFDYWGNSTVTFQLKRDRRGGTELTVTDKRKSDLPRVETLAGWVSLLLNLKAWVDFSVDLRNHDKRRTWANGYCDN